MPDVRPFTVAVFCGSSPGNDPIYLETATAVGRRLAERGIGVVYGGGHVGLMGAVADAAMDAGGTVTGVIPRALQKREQSDDDITELILVETMHERKTIMAERSDAFLALPGGPGTLEEITEQWTWAQLGIHSKPCAFLNVAGYYDPIHPATPHRADPFRHRPGRDRRRLSRVRAADDRRAARARRTLITRSAARKVR